MRLLDVKGAGVMMADDRGVLRSVIVSSDAVRDLEGAELDRGRGPCVESHRVARAVIHADAEVTDPRWPEFGPHARAAGMRAVHAIPVLGGDMAIGVLNLFRATPGGLSESDAVLAQQLADAAGTVVDQPPRSTRTHVDADALAAGFADAAVTERAKGILAVRLRVDLDTAHAVLRRVARERGCGMGELAAAVAAGTTTIALPLSVTPPPSDATDTH
jgi:GAF domain-containing protein